MTNPHEQLTSQIDQLEEDIAFMGYVYNQADGPERRADVQDDIDDLMNEILALEYKLMMKELNHEC